jgi:hypothetical protein
VWLLDYAPTTANLNSTGQFTDAAYYFGPYLIGNFGKRLIFAEWIFGAQKNTGLPPIGPTPVPPATLTMPDVSAYPVGSEMYLAVVETANNCPPVRRVVYSCIYADRSQGKPTASIRTDLDWDGHSIELSK